MKEIYLDYAATTPVDPAVLRAMQPYFTEKFGNPGSLHSFGQAAIGAVDQARETVAQAIGRPSATGFREVIFTGSATEANNLALRGTLSAHHRITNQLRINEFVDSQQIRTSLITPKVIVSAVEHESILETARELEREGVEVAILPVNKEGVVDLAKFKKLLDERTVLVSVMYANNEIGTIQPLAEISKIIKNFRGRVRNDRIDRVFERSANERRSSKPIIEHRSSNPYPLFHTDAVQAFQFLDCNVDALGVDALTLSAHKIYGPKGIAALYVRSARSTKHEARNPKQASAFKTLKIKNFPPEADPPLAEGIVSDFGFRDSNFPVMSALITGGGQEFGLRSGTENVPAIVGFGEAARLVERLRVKETKRLRDLRDDLWKTLHALYPQLRLHGAPLHGSRLPNNLHIRIPGRRAEEVITQLDMHGVAASAGSACAARTGKDSAVLHALGLSPAARKESIRLTLGRFTTPAEVRQTVQVIRTIMKEVQTRG